MKTVFQTYYKFNNSSQLYPNSGYKYGAISIKIIGFVLARNVSPLFKTSSSYPSTSIFIKSTFVSFSVSINFSNPIYENFL